MKNEHSVAVTGAGGRIGRLLRHVWQQAQPSFSTSWFGKAAGRGLQGWDLLRQDAPDFPKGGTLLHLAAILPGPAGAAHMADNVAMARKIAALDQGARFSRLVFLSSVAVYAPQPGPIDETVPPGPISDYGRTKLEAEQILRHAFGERLTVLRLANLAGADALLGGNASGADVVLDPVAGQDLGPVRSYIGPLTFARALAGLLEALHSGIAVPPVLNVAAPGALAMGQLLTAAARPWHFGPARDGVVARVEVDVSWLLRICPLPRVDAAAIGAELAALNGDWP